MLQGSVGKFLDFWHLFVKFLGCIYGYDGMIGPSLGRLKCRLWMASTSQMCLAQGDG